MDYEGLIFIFVARLGFEPKLKEPESSVLPLYYRAISLAKLIQQTKIQSGIC